MIPNTHMRTVFFSKKSKSNIQWNQDSPFYFVPILSLAKYVAYWQSLFAIDRIHVFPLIASKPKASDSECKSQLRIILEGNIYR